MNLLYAPQKNALMNLFTSMQGNLSESGRKSSDKKVKSTESKLNDPLHYILSWRQYYKYYVLPKAGTYELRQYVNIVYSIPSSWGQDLQGIFINIDWNKTKMTIPFDVMSNGIVFIWGAKHCIGALMSYFDSMGYTYADNFIFVLLDKRKIPVNGRKQLKGNTSLLKFLNPGYSLNYTPQKSTLEYELGKVDDPAEIFVNYPSKYFCETQKVLYMFRKINKKMPLELRHQRTSDVYFTLSEGQQLDWKAKYVAYKMIETLLINANYKVNQPLKLLYLWGYSDMPRKGWITIYESPSYQEKYPAATMIEY